MQSIGCKDNNAFLPTGNKKNNITVCSHFFKYFPFNR